MRILIVEDEPDLLDALKKQLQSSGYSVDGCGNGLDKKCAPKATPPMFCF